MYFFDSMYFLLVLIPSLLIAGGASMLVRSAFNKYSKVGMRSGMSGGEAARLILDKAGLYNVAIQSAHGRLSDHYDPRTQTLALSADVLNGRSLAAVGVAAHEAGHALQHAKNYVPLHVRSALVPLAGVLSPIGFYAMFLGLFLSKYLVLAGVILFGSVLLFQLVTLPVEFDASARAKRQLVEHGIVGADEMTGVHAVLNAAALTYVAAVMSTLLTMVYYLWRSGLIGGRR